MRRAQGETSDCSRHFGWNDFDCVRLEKSTECPLQGCSATLLSVPYRGGTLPWCPEHGIRLHSNTFVYGMGRIHAMRRVYAISLSGRTAEGEAKLAVAGKLREATKFLTGRSLSSTPHLYLWGRRIDDPNGKHELYAPLCQVRAKPHASPHSGSMISD